MFTPRHILVPSDFSVYSASALLHAVKIATQSNAKICLLHVVDEALWQSASDYRLNDAVIREIIEHEVEVSMEKLQRDAECIMEANGDMDISVNVTQGIPYNEIINMQEEKKIDLIVISSHGKTGMMKHLMGSVAEKVLRNSQCDVLLVKA